MTTSVFIDNGGNKDIQGVYLISPSTEEPVEPSTGSGATVATVDNIVSRDTDGTLFYKRISGDNPPASTYWDYYTDAPYTITGTPTPYVVTTTNIVGNVEITNDVGNKIPVTDDLLLTAIKSIVQTRTVFDTPKVVSSIDHVSVKFEYDRVSDDILTTGTTTGTVTASNGQLVLNSGSNGVAVALSRDRMRYMTGHEFEWLLTAEFENISLTTGQFMFAGVMHLNAANNGIQNGFGIGYYNDGAGASFGAWRYKAGVLQFIKQADFPISLNTSGIGNTSRVWDATEANKGAIFQGTGGYLGKAPLTCSINRGFDLSENKKFAPFAYFDFSATKGNHLGNTGLQVGAFCNGGTNNIIRIGSLSVKSWTDGNSDIAQKSEVVPQFTKSSIGAETPLLAIRNNATFNGLPNSVIAVPLEMNITQTAGAQALTLKFYKATAVTGGTFTAINTESPCSYNTTATSFTASGAEVFPAFQTWQNTNSEKRFIDPHVGIVLRIYPGETLVVTGQAGANANCLISYGQISQF